MGKINDWDRNGEWLWNPPVTQLSHCSVSASSSSFNLLYFCICLQISAQVKHDDTFLSSFNLITFLWRRHFLCKCFLNIMNLYLEQEVMQSLTNLPPSWASPWPGRYYGTGRVHLRAMRHRWQSEAGAGHHWVLMRLRHRQELQVEERDGRCLWRSLHHHRHHLFPTLD